MSGTLTPEKAKAMNDRLDFIVRLTELLNRLHWCRYAVEVDEVIEKIKQERKAMLDK